MQNVEKNPWNSEENAPSVSDFDDVVKIGSSLGMMLRSRGKLEDAEPVFRRTFANNEEKLGPEHPRTLTSMSNLAEVLTMLGKLEEAEPLYRKAVASNEQELGPEH